MNTLTGAIVLLVCMASTPRAAVDVQWFYTEGCYGCREVREEVAKVEYRYSNAISVARFDIADLENYKRLMEMEQKAGVSKSSPMEVFVGRSCLLGHREILDKLDQTVAAAVAEKEGEEDGETDSREPAFARGTPRRSGKTRTSLRAPLATAVKNYAENAGKDEKEELFRHMKPLVVAGAGLIDGINPCAFATVVFLVSILASRRFSRKEIVMAGLAFSGAVFLSYFLIGLGAFRILYSLESFHKTAAVFYWLVVVGVIGLGLVSLKDAVAYRKTGKAGDVALRMSDASRRVAHGFLTKNVQPGVVVGACFVAGGLVSVLELVCTGQIYLPTIMVMVRTASARASGIGYLLLYNTLFIVPLLAVMTVFILGLKSERLVSFSRRSFVSTKVLLAVFFFVLAAVLVVARLF